MTVVVEGLRPGPGLRLMAEVGTGADEDDDTAAADEDAAADGEAAADDEDTAGAEDLEAEDLAAEDTCDAGAGRIIECVVRL